MAEHTTHYDDCGCLSARYAELVRAAEAVLTAFPIIGCDLSRQQSDAIQSLDAATVAVQSQAADASAELARLREMLEAANDARLTAAMAHEELAQTARDLASRLAEARSANAKLNRRAQKAESVGIRMVAIEKRISEHKRGKPLGRIEAQFALAAAQVDADAMCARLAEVEPVVRAAVKWRAAKLPADAMRSCEDMVSAVDALRPETRREYEGERFRDDTATTPEGCEAQDEGFA